MSRTVSRRLLAQSPSAALAESVPIHRLSLQCLRSFSMSSRRRADGDGAQLPRAPAQAPRSPASPSLHPKAFTQAPKPSTMDTLSKLMQTNTQSRGARGDGGFGIPTERVASPGLLVDYRAERRQEPHHIHVYATRHNTHITITRPDGGPIISKSAGSLGFRHSQRKHYDSAFQLASFVFGRLHESGKSRDITKIAVIMRGFGAGREAVTKALLGSEGRYLRGKIVSVSDSTRIKFGGTRSKRARRLG